MGSSMIAVAGVRFGQGRVRGAGTASFTLSPDASALSVLFDDLRLDLQGSAAKRRGQVERTLEIPVEHDGGLKATIESGLGLDLRGKIAATVVGAGYELLELGAVSLSLEEVFMQLTTDEKAVEEKAA